MVSLYFGLPRSGKTTLACCLALENVSKRPVYCNFPCKVPGVVCVKNSAIGRYDMSDSLIIIDEGSLYADSRGFKGFPTELVSFFCLHGHWNCDVVIFTQIYNRVDSTIRQLCEQVFYIRKNPIFRFITSVYRVPYGIAFTPPPNSEGRNKYGDINEGYKEPSLFQRTFCRRIVRRKYYQYFDTHWKPYVLPPLDESCLLDLNSGTSQEHTCSCEVTSTPKAKKKSRSAGRSTTTIAPADPKAEN